MCRPNKVSFISIVLASVCGNLLTAFVVFSRPLPVAVFLAFVGLPLVNLLFLLPWLRAGVCEDALLLDLLADTALADLRAATPLVDLLLLFDLLLLLELLLVDLLMLLLGVLGLCDLLVLLCLLIGLVVGLSDCTLLGELELVGVDKADGKAVGNTSSQFGTKQYS